MSERFQTWLLANTKGLQYFVNERMAPRGGPIGWFGRTFHIGQRQMSTHAFGRALRVVNVLMVQSYLYLAAMRPVASRFMGIGNGPLNYTGIGVYIFATGCICANWRFIRARDVLTFNYQDQPEFWYARYNMMFPPNFLHNRISAHYIEINHIFTVEMMKKYQTARKDILRDREAHSEQERRTKYITNPNYVYEAFGSDDCTAVKRAKASSDF